MCRIVYLCPADNTPTGGVKVIYRHAELLTSLGADASILHPFNPEFSCTWFRHHARIRRSTALDPTADFVIIPELWAASFGPQCIDQSVRFGIFVQNAYLTHPVLPDQPAELFDKVYRDADLVLSISDDSSRMVTLNYPRIDRNRLLRVRYSVPECFHAPSTAATSSITFMPRKMASHAQRVVFALRQRLPAHWAITPIHGVDEATVATMLARSRVFLSFSEFEGLPLPPLEAALAGNLVIGYTGQGAREYWYPPNFLEINQGDIHGFVEAVYRAARQIDARQLSPEDLLPGIARLTQRFSLATETTNLRALLARIERCFEVCPASTSGLGDTAQHRTLDVIDAV